MKITMLGTGTSSGVPTLGCCCDVCTSPDARDKRTRCSAMVETASTRLLIDCGPDFRQQMMGREFRRIDGILVTHAHYDHVGGIDDVRPYCKFGDVDIYADARASASLRQALPYCFAAEKYPNIPNICLTTIAPHVPLHIGDIDVMPIEIMHGRLPILGYRFGRFAYITDMKSIGDAELTYLTGTEVLVVNALRFVKEHHSHQLVSDAVDFARRVGARRTLLIHSSHHIGRHEEVNRQLPEGVEMAYDGQVLEV